MNWPLKVQGRLLEPADVELIRGLMQDHSQWNRSRLSRELCTRWNWHRPDRQMKDMACRELLLKLERTTAVSESDITPLSIILTRTFGIGLFAESWIVPDTDICTTKDAPSID